MASKSVLVKANERPNNRLECPICKERFWLRCKYDDHVATHELSRVSCNICSKGFYDQKLLDEHYLTHTNVIKTYDCRECARKFLQKFQLEQHMQFHKPVDFIPFTINKKKSVHFNKVTHVKNIIDDTSDSEEFHTSDSEDEEECNISDFEDYLPANKLVQTRSGRVVKRKKLFDEEETEIKHKFPKTEQAYTRRSIITEYKHQKIESPKISNIDAVQKSPKPKQIYAKKSTVSEYNSQRKQSSKTSAIDAVQKNIEKQLSVVVERMPDDVYARYVKKGNVFTENQANFSSTQESSKGFASVIAKKPNSLVNSVSIDSISRKKLSSYKVKPRQLDFENVQESPKVTAPNLTKKPHNSTTADSTIDKRSEITESSKFTNKNIVNNSRSCSKTVGKSSSRKSGTDNLNKSILSTFSQASAYKSPTCKEYVYVGSNPDFRKIKQAIEEVSTMSNHETSFCNNNSLKRPETMTQSKRVLNSLNSNISSKSNMHLSNNTSLTGKSKKSGLKNPVSPINSQTVNQLNGSIPNEEGILEEKIVGECRVVKVTPEYMKKIQRNLLNQSIVPSTPNLHSPSKQMPETVAASHLNSDLNKSSTAANNHEIINENEKPNAYAGMSVEANTINNITPTKQLTEIASVNASSAVSNSNESLTLSTEKHLAFNNLNKSITTPARKPEAIREIQKLNIIANASIEIDTTNTCQRSSIEIPIVDLSNTLEHANVSGKDLASNLNESATVCFEGLGNQKSNAVANTSIEANNNLMKTCQTSFIETPIVYPSSSSVEPSKVLPMQYFQLPNNQVTWTTSANASLADTNSNGQPFLAGKQETVNESQISITSVKPYKVNNTKQGCQSNLVQSQVVYPLYLLHTSTPIIQNPNVSLLNSEIPTVQSPNVSLVHTEIPTVQSPNVSLVHTQIPNIQSPDISLVHSEIAAVESPVSVVFTTIQTIQSPTASVMHSKIQAQQTTKLPFKKNETPGKALHINKNLALSKRKQIQKDKYKIKSVFQEPYCFTDTSFEFNKSNLKTYQKVAVENTQMLPQSNLSKLQTENITANSIAESEQEHQNELNDSLNSVNDNYEDSATEDAVSSNLTLLTRESLLEEPYVFTTDTSFEFNNNLTTYQTVENTQIVSQSNLNKLQTENIAGNTIAESEQELHQNELSDSMKSVNDNCKDNFTEEAVSSNKNNNLIEEIPVSHNEEDENEQTLTQTTLNKSQTENITMEVFDNFQTEPVKNMQQKNHSSDEPKDKYRNENEIEILPQININLAITDENIEITNQSHKITPVIINSYTIDDDSFEKWQLNSIEETVVALNENIQVTQQSNMNDLLSMKPTDNSRTKSVGKEIKKRLRSHANKCESNQIDTAVTTPSKNKQISLKRSPASSSKTVKKQKVAQNRAKRREINENKSKDIKNRTDTLSNVSLNKNNESKEASPKSNPDIKSPKNNKSKKASQKSNPDNKPPKNNESKEVLPKGNPDNKLPKNNKSKKASQKSNPDNKSPKNNESKEALPKSNPDNKSPKNNKSKSQKSNPDNKPPKNNESKEASLKSNPDNKSPKNNKSKSQKSNPDNKPPKNNESKEASPKSNPDNKSHKKNESKEASSKSNPDYKSPKHIHEKLLQRYQAKLEEKERKKKEKYELKKQIKYVERFLSSPSRDSIQENFSKGMFPSSSISVNDIAKIHGKCATETKKQTCVSREIGTILTMTNNLNDSSESSFCDIGNDLQKKNESESSKHFEETRAIAKARSITLKFNKDLNENESLQLLDELDELIDTYNIGDKCPFLDKTIRFCCLFVDSYKVRQKAISLRNKLKNLKSS